MTKIIIPTMAIAMFVGCASGPRGHHKSDKGPVYYGVAVLNPTKNNMAAGKVVFSEAFGKVSIEGKFTGLDKNSKHGVHIHEFGDCTAADASSAGGHYNPEGMAHGGIDSEARHVGDLGNIVTDNKGNGTLKIEVPNMSISGMNPILGRGLIIHKDVDDLVSQPTGGAGDRIACGVIGAATR